MLARELVSLGLLLFLCAAYVSPAACSAQLSEINKKIQDHRSELARKEMEKSRVESELRDVDIRGPIIERRRSDMAKELLVLSNTNPIEMPLAQIHSKMIDLRSAIAAKDSEIARMDARAIDLKCEKARCGDKINVLAGEIRALEQSRDRLAGK